MSNVIKLATKGNIKTNDGREFTRLVGGFGEDKPVITDKQIAELLGYHKKERQVRVQINNNIDHFEDSDLIDLRRVHDLDTLPEVLIPLGYAKQSITQAKNIYICGARTSESVARYLTYNLNRMFLNATYVSDSLSGELTTLKKIAQEDVLIAVTVSRYNKGICKIASLCKQWHIPVIAITDSFDSPLIPCSDFQLVGKCRSNAFHNSIISQVFLCDLLIKICSQVNPARVRENLKRDEMIVEEMDYFIRK